MDVIAYPCPNLSYSLTVKAKLIRRVAVRSSYNTSSHLHAHILYVYILIQMWYMNIIYAWYMCDLDSDISLWISYLSMYIMCEGML